YPDLSMMWLMFGEGAMLLNENIKFSQPQNSNILDFEAIQSIENQGKNDEQPLFDPTLENYLKKEPCSTLFDSINAVSHMSAQDRLGASSDNLSSPKGQSNAPATPTGLPGISMASDAPKRIVNIMVFYSDNSFESFVPADLQ
ncbi:MAG: hypothetical protein K2L49_03750, partial [Muribaculaceae bacterium]|nr:hypothetical protein [Muribaculaceae bacterium]